MNDLVGKKVSATYIDGYGIEICFTDGTVFIYDVADGGCSCWEIKNKCSECQESDCDWCVYWMERTNV